MRYRNLQGGEHRKLLKEHRKWISCRRLRRRLWATFYSYFLGHLASGIWDFVVGWNFRAGLGEGWPQMYCIAMDMPRGGGLANADRRRIESGHFDGGDLS